MTTSSRIVVLVSGAQKRTYPVPNGTALQDEYEFDGKRWTVTAVISSEDVPVTGLQVAAQ
jgi:hypothetical protein